MDYTKYTDRQKDIVSGKTPLYMTLSIEIRRLYEKALFTFDADVVKFAEKELKRRKLYVQERKPYSQKQLDIINEVSPIEDADKGFLYKLYYLAAYNGDVKLGARIEVELKARGVWIKRIAGYTSIQAAIIQDITDIRLYEEPLLFGLDRSYFISYRDNSIYEKSHYYLGSTN